MQINKVQKSPAGLFLYLPISWIYHNIRCPHRLRRPQGVSDGCTVKQVTNHPKSRQKRAR
ncbi:hypothetical protein Z701_004915 [Salmonella enterica subsp. enterica serovar Ohio]|nr:hypothetical protein [Salmonella enterica]EBQ9291899.1 hypothetical protein [Salmonella enterica subsp. enterica serovar Ohio]EGZ4373181.1 hypothetical protein [Salmonella enterica subsp. enterica serovar Cerro]EBI8477919.1 hypothetical protein [Salmonella enterica]EBV7064433.1 hypothetical protein [Salmonella enterica subsp. enterica serovar Ohio]